MASYAADEANDRRVRALAARMMRNQSIEINEYAQTAERFGLDVEIERFDHGSDPMVMGG